MSRRTNFLSQHFDPGRSAFTLIAALGAMVAGHGGVSANPRPLPFTYPYATLPQGSAEVELYADFVPLRALSAETGKPATYGAMQYQAEIEYGITDRLELGLYFTFAPPPSAAFSSVGELTEGTGLKQRLRLRLAEEGEWPVDVALYGEMVENQQEFEVEAKILLQRRIERLTLLVNLWAEREFEYSGDGAWVLNPTAGATYEMTPMIHPGIEYWMRAEFPTPAPANRPFELGPHHYVGPAIMFNFGTIWWSTAVYARVSHFSRTMEVGEGFGSVWVRSVVGLNL